MLEQRVLVVSNDHETRDSVQGYLTRAGAATTGVSALEEVAVAAQRCDAVLLFADDYAPLDAQRLLSTVPMKVCVVVTSRIEAADLERNMVGERSKLVVLRRPAWGWMLLDALRSGPDQNGS